LLFTGRGFAGVIETIQPQVYMSWNYNDTATPDVGPDSNSDDDWRSVDEGEIEIGPVETRPDTPVAEKRQRGEFRPYQHSAHPFTM
jgi:hypothetical protein